MMSACYEYAYTHMVLMSRCLLRDTHDLGMMKCIHDDAHVYECVMHTLMTYGAHGA
jgi:hypothetical protein